MAAASWHAVAAASWHAPHDGRDGDAVLAGRCVDEKVHAVLGVLGRKVVVDLDALLCHLAAGHVPAVGAGRRGMVS